jgi:N-acetylglucosaminyldiphosphoundecaprenol N-acetyl-beta-D-mannosaminyltransferase
VGAAFDFHTGKVKQAPKLMQKVGLEWFFRLLMEPKRLYRRYLEIVPKFIWYNLKEFLHLQQNK